MELNLRGEGTWICGYKYKREREPWICGYKYKTREGRSDGYVDINIRERGAMDMWI